MADSQTGIGAGSHATPELQQQLSVLRAAGISNADISKMAGYAGHNGKRDVENFLRQAREGGARAWERIALFHRAFEEWTAAAERPAAKEESPESPKPTTLNIESSDQCPLHTEELKEPHPTKCAHEMGKELEGRCSQGPQLSSVEWLCRTIAFLHDSGLSSNDISKMAGYCGRNGKRDLASFERNLREGKRFAFERLETFRSRVAAWDRSRVEQGGTPAEEHSPHGGLQNSTATAFHRPELAEAQGTQGESQCHRSLTVADPAVPQQTSSQNPSTTLLAWVTTSVDLMRDTGLSWTSISIMAGYSGHNGYRDIAAFLRQLAKPNERTSKRIELFRAAVASRKSSMPSGP